MEKLEEVKEDIIIRDYSLIGVESKKAIELGLAEADWYQSPVPRAQMKELLKRRNGPAIRDTLLWFGLIFGSGYAFFMLWGSWWAILPYIVYSVLYASSSDSRWHESSHGTAFKTDWMNNALYEIASFMVFRQSITWKWSHTRHHSDTIIRGRDPEIAVPRPPDIPGLIMQLFAIKSTPVELKKIIRHAFGRIDPEVATYVPKEEHSRVFVRARIYLLIYAGVIGLSLYYWTLLPLFFIGFPTFFGSWLMVIYGTTQHAGLAENVLDHRLNCRTVYMNAVHRYLYWNMNYHVEHHMFPLVPYHALPKLHEIIKHDCPKPYTNIAEAYREIIPTLLRQTKDPNYHVVRELPRSAEREANENARNNVTCFVGNQEEVENGWARICSASDLAKGDVVRFDLQEETFAVYKTESGNYYATEGICTHGSTHLAEGLVIGDQIECPKHNGRFSVVDGSVKRPPVCLALNTFPVKEKEGSLYINVSNSVLGVKDSEEEFEVINNQLLTPFLTELTLRPLNKSFTYSPGEYLRMEIPAYVGNLEQVQVPQAFQQIWKEEHIHDFRVNNLTKVRRNYSFASNPSMDADIKLNVRLALPPAESNGSAGVGSSYVFSLKPGAKVKATGPFGDFKVEESDKEKVYIGGGAGMAPLRSHISYLLETVATKAKITFWYGARSANDLFYTEYFNELNATYTNFHYTVALSDPGPNGQSYPAGFIHQVVYDCYLKQHPDISSIEFYLCGPPPMIQATRNMLHSLGVKPESIKSDEF